MANSTIDLIRLNIKKYRNQKGLSQNKLSELIDVSVDYIYLIENGKRTPSLKRLLMIAEVLEIDAYKLLM